MQQLGFDIDAAAMIFFTFVSFCHFPFFLGDWKLLLLAFKSEILFRDQAVILHRRVGGEIDNARGSKRRREGEGKPKEKVSKTLLAYSILLLRKIPTKKSESWF